MARICETVTASTMTALRQARDRAVDADVVELRLDGVANLDVAGALDGRLKPVIVTCRPVWEGGAFHGSERDRLRVLAEAIARGAEYVDVEYRAERSALPAADRTRLVVSLHDYAGVPADLAATVRAMRGAAGSGIIKVATATTSPSDCVRLRDAVGRGTDQVVIAMGGAGFVSRACPWIFDSIWTYGGTAAPGQTSVAELLDLYRVRRTSAATRIYALIGAPLAHSASPAMLNAAFEAAGIDAVYVPIETRDAQGFLHAAASLGIAGASVTAPLKSGWDALGVAMGDADRRIGAINTLAWDGRGWTGRNFDVDGFLAPLAARGVNLQGVTATVLGAGGAARAVASVLAGRGARVSIAARRPAASAALAASLGVAQAPWPPDTGVDVLVNTTPVGTWPDADQTPLAACDRARLVYDLVYNPPETRLLRLARAAGAEVVGGLEMLIAQAEAQFLWWTGKPAPVGVMERAATAFLRQRIARGI